MFGLTYFFYAQWKKTQYNISNKLVNNPQNFYEYQYGFVMTMTNISHNNYKFGRFYNLKELLISNLKFNKKLKGYLFSVIDLQKYIVTLKIQTDNIIPDIVYTNLSNIYTNILPNNFKFENALNTVASFIGNDDNILIYVFYNFIINKLNLLLSNKYMLPGVLSSFNENISNNNLSLFMYEMDNDPNEIINLLDPKIYPNYNYLLNSELNDRLNKAIINHDMLDAIYIIPDKIFQITLTIIYLFGGFLSNFKDISSVPYESITEMLFSLRGKNNFDTTTDVVNQTYSDNAYAILNFEAFKPKSSFILPYSISDSSINFFYVGEKQYIQRLFNTNYIYTIFPNPKLSSGILNKNTQYKGTDSLFIKSYIYSSV